MPAGADSRRVKSAIVSGRRIGRSTPRSISVGEDGEIFGGGEQAGVPGDSAQHAGIFVLHFALDDAIAEGGIVGRWAEWNLRASLLGD